MPLLVVYIENEDGCWRILGVIEYTKRAEVEKFLKEHCTFDGDLIFEHKYLNNIATDKRF